MSLLHHRSSLAILAVATACAGARGPGPAGPGAAAAPPPASRPVSAPASQPAAAGATTQAVKAYLYLEAPLFSEAFAATPVATVGDEVITVRELTAAMVLANAEHKGAEGQGKAYLEVLNRLIGTRLLVAEAHTMGLDEQPELKAARAKTVDSILIGMVKDMATKDVVVDPKEVEKTYQDSVREWKVQSVFFEKEADARAMAAALESGGDFEALAKQAVESKKAKGAEEAQWMPSKRLGPQALAAADRLSAGQTSPVFRLPDGWAILRIEEVRYPDDPEARKNAAEVVSTRTMNAALTKFYDGLIAQYVKKDERLIKSLSFEARSPGFAALEKDKRIVARVDDGEPVTVAELAREIRAKFFHGVDRAIREKKVNHEKLPALDKILYGRVVKIYAAREKITESVEYRRQVAEATTAQLVSSFIEKVVLPEVDVKETEAKDFYDQHVADFSYPEFYRLVTIGFTKQAAAQAALASLKKGTDPAWLKAHADDLAPEEARSLGPEDMPYSLAGMPPELASLVKGGHPGDVRLYAAPGGLFYVVQVKDHIPPQPQPYPNAREKIVKQLFNQRLKAAIDDWTVKLRKAYEVRIYIVRLGPRENP